jgi:hypothetical protein
MAGVGDSGYVYRSTVSAAPYGTIRACLRAMVDTGSGDAQTVYHFGYIQSLTVEGGLCDPPQKQLGVGWLGVTIDGYSNGSFCGTSYYSYSSTVTAIHGVSRSGLCWNWFGWQNFHTNAFGRVYSSTCGCYTNIPGISSPGQNG